MSTASDRLSAYMHSNEEILSQLFVDLSLFLNKTFLSFETPDFSTVFLQDEGNIRVVMPDFEAQSILCESWLTGRSSPVNPTSPRIIVSALTGIPLTDEMTAARIARSRAGSETLRPPTTLMNESNEGVLSLRNLSATARSIVTLFFSSPVHIL